MNDWASIGAGTDKCRSRSRWRGLRGRAFKSGRFGGPPPIDTCNGSGAPLTSRNTTHFDTAAGAPLTHSFCRNRPLAGRDLERSAPGRAPDKWNVFWDWATAVHFAAAIPRSTPRCQVTTSKTRVMLEAMSDVTRILSQIESGDPSAAEQLLPLVYDELRQLAAARWPRRSRARRCRPRRWFTRRTCGWWTPRRFSSGTAGGTFSPPRPRPCGGFDRSSPSQTESEARREACGEWTSTWTPCSVPGRSDG